MKTEVAEITVESALKELREMGFMRCRLEFIQIFDSEFPPSTRVEISIWRRQQSGKVIYDSTLNEAMDRVRAWKERQ